MKRLKSLLNLLGWCFLCTSVQASSTYDCVILLHGLYRTHRSMTHLKTTLHKHQYYVVNQNYPSTQKNIHELANTYLPSMIEQCLRHNPAHIHFVTHSLGGLILQDYLQNHPLPQIQYIIMLGPPNHGSPLADLLHRNWIYRFVLGPAGQELLTHDHETIDSKIPLHIGIIAGNYDFVPLAKLIFREDNDGLVSVSSTKTKRMQDFILLPVSHTFMMSNPTVEKQILAFLAKGHFDHDYHSSS